MVLANLLRFRRMLTLAVAGTLTASAALVAATPAQAVETYPRPLDSTITISGHGYGHGHGMSQWGAYGAAAVGKLSWQSILAFYYPGTALGNLGNPTIRVRLDAVGSGTLYVYNVAGLRLGGTALPGPTTGITQYRVRPTTGGLQVDKLISAVWSSYTTSASPAVFSSSTGLVDVSLASGARRAYRGSISANQASPTTIMPVSVLPMESYLRAVVPAEMPASWHPDAVRAQAVAARSYAGYDLAHAPAGRAWDTCDTTSCQMYSGAPAEYPASDDAVLATAGQMLTYGGTVAFTQFGAADGGWTAAGGQPYLPAKADPYDGAIPNSANTWATSITASRIEAIWPSIGTYLQLRILSRDGHGQWGGRVLTAAIDGSNGSVTLSGAAIRSALGLRSEWFIPTGSPPAPPANGWVGVFSPGDFTGDGRADIMGITQTGDLYLYRGNGLGGFTGGGTNLGVGWAAFTTVFSTGDFTGDGHADILGILPGGDLRLYRGNGLGGFTGGGTNIGVGWAAFTTVFSTGDFTGDGHADILGILPGGDLRLYRGNGLGGFTGGGTNIGVGWAAFTTVFSTGDFTGDGHADILGILPGGDLRLYRGNGLGGFTGGGTNIGVGWGILP
jgi:SpoIID/LytB domain protein